MRFRLGTTGAAGGQQMFDGVSRGFANLGMMPVYQAQAADEAQNADMKRQLIGSQMRESDAHAALYGQQGEDLRAQQARGGFDQLARTALAINRVSPDQIPEASNYLQTGKLPSMYQAPGGDGVGPVAPAPDYANAGGLGGRIMQTLGLLQGGLAVGDKNIDHVAEAQGRFQHQDAVRAVYADPSTAGRTGQAFAASEGKKLVDNIGDSGAGYNQFTGEGTTLNPGMVALFGDKGRAEIGQRNAAAGASNASAAMHRASERKTVQEIEQGARTGQIALVTGTDGVVTAVDKRTLQVTPLVGADGRPVVRGAAVGSGKPMTEGQAKANLYGGRMTESGKILDDLESQGVYFPGQLKSAAEGIGGAIPIIGDSLREGAGNLMNRAPAWAGGPNEQQQQVEQARRDFINAVLRRESGAAISQGEFENANKQYFPQPGDERHPKVLEQKRRNRQIATTLMLQEVPEAQRYQRKPAAAPTAPSVQATAPEGTWGPGNGQRNVSVSY